MSWTIRGNPKAIFSDPHHGPQYLRLMLTMNVLASLHRPLWETMKPDYEDRFSAAVKKGDRLVFLALIYSALSEALDAYAAFRGTIKALAMKANSSHADHVKRLLMASHKDKSDQSTFLNRIANRVRCQAGFHWDTDAIRSVMDQFTATDGILFRADANTTGNVFSRFCFADGVMAKVAFPQESHDDREIAIREVMEVTQSFFIVVEAALAQRMLDAGCSRVDE